MAKKITDLPTLSNADNDDLIPIVDISGAVTKKVAAIGLAGAVVDGIEDGSFPSQKIDWETLGNFAIGNVAWSTGTSNIVITGIGFNPRMVELWLLRPASNTASYQSIGVAMSPTNQFCQGISGGNSSAPARNYSSTTECLAAVNGSVTIATLKLVSMDSDGFTLARPTSNNDGGTIAYRAWR